MTKSQAKTVERIREWVLAHDCYGNHEHYEIKQFDVIEKESGNVWVYSVAGRKGDEDTVYLITLRTRRKIAIGSRGGVRAYKFVKMKQRIFRGWRNAMIYGY